jgi:hypothetical protein
MDSETRADSSPNAEAAEFVRFCYGRRRVGWPELYDEMCAVAGRGLFRGWSLAELAERGVGFSLAAMPALAMLVERVLTEDGERRGRPLVPLFLRPASPPLQERPSRTPGSYPDRPALGRPVPARIRS